MRVLVVILVVIAASAARAGVVIESVERDVRSGQTLGMQRLLVQHGAARLEHSADAAEPSYVVFRDDTLYFIETARRRYTAMNRRTIEALAGTMNSAMQEMRARLEKMSPQQRAMMEQAIGNMGGPGAARNPPAPLQARDLGRSDRVAGRVCRLWDLGRAGIVEQQLCVVPFSEVPGTEDLLSLSTRMASLLRPLAEAMPAFGGSSRDIEAMDAVKGYPILIRDYDGGVPSGREWVLQSWREQPLAASQFEVPADFRRRDSLGDLRR